MFAFIFCILFFLGLCAQDNGCALLNGKKISEPLQQLMSKDGCSSNDGVPEDALLKTQHAWLRDPQLERDEIKDDAVKIFHRNRYLFEIDRLNLLKSIAPKEKKYDHMLVMGSNIESEMLARLLFAKKLLEDGLKVNKLHVLVGGQQLKSQQTDYPETEAVMAAGLCRQVGLMRIEGCLASLLFVVLPGNFSQVETNSLIKETKVSFIIVSKEDDARPNTQDTLKAWQHFNEQPGSCLLVSNQPYVQYQTSVACNTLPADYQVEGVGPEAVDGAPVNLYLDTIARWLYNEVQIMDKKKIRARL